MTDANGHYTVQAPEGEWLDISYVGFIPVTVKAGENRRTVMAEDSRLLDDVVVVGYGTQRRADLTGATSSIRGDELSDHASPNLDAQLEGALPGVEIIRNSGDPATAADVHVRGVTTISDSSPLIIVDGMPANSLNDINPNDVDRIDVLKDAATAAIYGARAAAGVSGKSVVRTEIIVAMYGMIMPEPFAMPPTVNTRPASSPHAMVKLTAHSFGCVSVVMIARAAS